MYKDFWAVFEAECASVGLVSKLPEFMKNFLNACGYNNAWALKEVDQDKITSLESFVEERHRKMVDTFDDYREIKPFEFSPGHRALIVGIKNQILSMEESKRPKLAKPKTKIFPDESELIKSLTSQMSRFTSNLSLKSN